MGRLYYLQRQLDHSHQVKWTHRYAVDELLLRSVVEDKQLCD